jgi:cbb3-type cytochrome oxidase subunit 3
MNKFINYVLLISLTLIFVLLGGYFAQKDGMLLALLVSISAIGYIYNKEQKSHSILNAN